jgi:hypothetical protein
LPLHQAYIYQFFPLDAPEIPGLNYHQLIAEILLYGMICQYLPLLMRIESYCKSSIKSWIARFLNIVYSARKNGLTCIYKEEYAQDAGIGKRIPTLNNLFFFPSRTI